MGPDGIYVFTSNYDNLDMNEMDITSITINAPITVNVFSKLHIHVQIKTSLT